MMETSISTSFVALNTLTSSTNDADGPRANLAEILRKNLEETEKLLRAKEGDDEGVDFRGDRHDDISGDASGGTGDGSGDVTNTMKSVGKDEEKTVLADRFIQTCLDVFSQICLAATDAECPWSVKEEAVLKRTLQLVVALGILPNLHANVGVPLHHRTSSGVRFAETSLKPCSKSQHGQLRRLHSLLHRLWHLCGVDAAFANLLVGSHFSDLLVGLIQVGHEPLTVSRAASPKEVADLKELKREARKTIAEILNKFFLPIVFQELLLLLKLSSSSTSPPPPWYKKTLCVLLSTLIIRPHGFLHLVASIGDSSSSSSSDGVEAKKYDAIAELVSTPPSGSGAGGKKFDVTREYLAPVCDQLFQLLDRCLKISSSGQADEDQLFQKEKQLRLLSHCIVKINEKYPMVAKTLIVDRILTPVIGCLVNSGGEGGGAGPNVSPSVLVLESSLDELVARLLFFSSQPSKLILGSESSSLFEGLFSPILHFLFQIFCFVKTGVSHLKQPLKDILIWYLKTFSGEEERNDSSRNKITTRLEEFLFMTSISAPIAPISYLDSEGIIKTKVGKVLLECLRFESGPNGGVLVKTRRNQALSASASTVAPSPDAETVVQTIREFCESFSCTGDFLLQMMRRLGDDVAESAEDQDPSTSKSSSSEASQIFADDASDFPTAKILTLRMIDALGTEASTPTAEMVVDDEKIIAFAQLTCRRCLIAGAEIDGETMSMTFGLISTMIIGKSIGKEEEEGDRTKWTTSLRTLIPVVKEVEEKVEDEAIKEMAKRTIQLIEGQLGNNNDNQSDSTKSNCKFSTASKLELALKDLGDPLIPVRGHALLVLAKLVASKDKEASDRKEAILEVFMANLLDEDTYIYLNAVKGLEALALAFPDKVLKTLCDEFVHLGIRGGGGGGGGLPADIKSTAKSGELAFRRRLNLGESIARTCRELGDMTPAYLPLLLNALLNGVRDDDSYIRASSLSTLGEALEKARFAVAGNSLFEIVATLSGAAKLDPAPEVRRGAVLVIRNVLQGLGVDAIEALGGEVLKELYRLLKRLYETDRDDVVRLQAQLAFEALDVLMRDFFFPKETLVKKISVLSVCDS